MYEATRAVHAEGTVSKRTSSARPLDPNPSGWVPWRCQSASASLLSTYCNGTDGTIRPASSRSQKTVSKPLCTTPPIISPTATCGKPSSLRSSPSAKTPLTVSPRETRRVSQHGSPGPSVAAKKLTRAQAQVRDGALTVAVGLGCLDNCSLRHAGTKKANDG